MKSNALKNTINFIRENSKAFFWIRVGLSTLLLFKFSQAYPQFIENYYSRGVFQGLRYLWDNSFSLLPFALIYLLLPLFVLSILIIWKKSKHFLLSLVAFVFAVITVFYWSWGFNYNRLSLQVHLTLPLVTPDKSVLESEFTQTIKRLNQLNQAINHQPQPTSLESQMRDNLTQVLKKLDYPTTGRVRVREIYPKGALIALGAAGIYIPFVGEGHFDAAILPLEHPALIAHEMCHGYGFSNEGECNFFALLATLDSDNAFVQYSGQLMYLKYLASDLYRMDEELYRRLSEQYSEGLKSDLKAIRENHQQYQPLFGNFSRTVYDQYLKNQGVVEGIRSYNTLVGLYIAFKLDTDPEPPAKKPD